MRAVAAWLVLAGFAVAGCVADIRDVQPDEQLAINVSDLQYEQVDVTAGPPGLDGWFPAGLTDTGEVFGQGFDCDDEFIVCSFHLVRRDRNGAFTTVAENFSVSDVNGKGDVGGCTIDDPETFAGRAAVVRSNGKLDLIPALPGEVASCVIKLSDARVAVVASFNGTDTTLFVRDGNQIRPFTVPQASVEDVNDRGEIAGIMFTDANRAFRFDSRTQITTVLEPVSPDPDSWGLGINRHGEVLGYSFSFNAIERIGKWNRQNEFETHFIEGIPEFPTISNRLNWNEAGVILISQTSDGATYLVPEPGTRLNLADLVTNGPVAQGLFGVGINKGADILATRLVDGTSFLFLRN